MPEHPHPAIVIAFGLLGCSLNGCDQEQEPKSTASPKSTPTRNTRPAADPPDQQVLPPPMAAPRNISELTAADAPALRDELRRNPQQWNSALGPFYRAWGAIAPEAALDAASKEGRTSVAAVTMALSGWASTDPDAAAAWLASQPDTPHRDRHATGLIQGWPAGRLSELATHLPTLTESSENSLLPVRLTARWLHDDPTAAAAWLQSLPAAQSTTAATELLFQQWGSADPATSGEFLANNPEAPNWDTAAAAYAKAVVPDDPNAATLWAEAITNPELRGQIKDVLPLLNRSRNPLNPGRPTLPPSP